MAPRARGSILDTRRRSMSGSPGSRRRCGRAVAEAAAISTCAFASASGTRRARNAGHQQRKADRVGEEPGVSSSDARQPGSSPHAPAARSDRAASKTSCAARPIASAPCARTSQVPRIAVSTTIGQRRPQADQPADLDEQGDLDQRNGDKRQEEPHGVRSFGLRRAHGGLGPPSRLHKSRRHAISTLRPKEVLMNSPIIQLLVLAGIAIFLILRLRSVLGTREGSRSRARRSASARRRAARLRGDRGRARPRHHRSVPEDSRHRRGAGRDEAGRAVLQRREFLAARAAPTR